MNKNYILPGFVILVSFFYGLPNIIMTNKLGSDYNPLVISGKSPIARDEAFAYAPFVNYILEGKLFLRDAYVVEYANYPTPFLGETVPSLIFAALAKLTGSVEKAFIAADFIFPPIIFLLFYILISFFIKHKIMTLLKNQKLREKLGQNASIVVRNNYTTYHLANRLANFVYCL